MISQTIECPNIRANTGNEKRSMLVDLIGKLCEASAERNLLKKKYQRCRKALRKLRTQGETLLQEVQRNKELIETRLREVSVLNDDRLSQQIRDLEELLRRQLDSQTEFLRQEACFECKPPSLRPRTVSVDDEPSLIRSPPKRSQPPMLRTPVEEEDEEEVPPPKPRRCAPNSRSSHEVHSQLASRMQRASAEREADEVLEEPRRPKQNGARNTSCRCGRRVNELVDLADHLRDDYKRLGQYFGDLSIDQLSRLNDSLVSEEHELGTTSD
jgi:hypothetical protein